MHATYRTLALIALTATMLALSTTGASAQERALPMPWDPTPPPAPRLGFYGYFDGTGQCVERVMPGTPAWQIGLEPGDVIVAINGRSLDYPESYFHALRHAARRGHATLAVRDVRTGNIVYRGVQFGGGHQQHW